MKKLCITLSIILLPRIIDCMQEDPNFKRQFSLLNAYRHRAIEPVYKGNQLYLHYKDYDDNRIVYEQLCEQVHTDLITIKHKIISNRDLYNSCNDRSHKKLINFFSLFWRKNSDIDLLFKVINENNDDELNAEQYYYFSKLKKSFEKYYDKQRLVRSNLSEETLQRTMRLELIDNRTKFEYALATSDYKFLKQALGKPLLISDYFTE